MATQSQKDILAKNLKIQLQNKGISQTDLAKTLDYPEMTVSNWINAKFYPRIDKIQEMADYFGINKSDLIEDKPISPTVSSTPTLKSDEEKLLSNYKNSNSQGKKIILDTSETISKTYPKVINLEPTREEILEFFIGSGFAALEGKGLNQMTYDELLDVYNTIREEEF